MGYLKKMIMVTAVFIFVSIILCQYYPGFAAARLSAAKEVKPKAVLVIIDRLTWDDFLKADIPVTKKLAGQGVVGLMTTNPAGGMPRVPNNTYATIGAGAKVSGGTMASQGFNTYEKAENDTAADTFYRRTGIRANGHEVVHLGLTDMVLANKGLKYSYALGAIGSVLHQNGLKTAVLGNADNPTVKNPIERYRRAAAAVAMDGSGLVDYGDVSQNMYRKDPQSLAGISTDYRYLLERFSWIKNSADFIVIETGDTSRIDENEFISSDGVADRAKEKALSEFDRFMTGLLQQLDLSQDLVIISVPEPPVKAMATGRFLTPFIMAGHGVDKGVAWSGTTKRDGLIANIDIAPTVTGFFNLSAQVKGEAGNSAVNLGGQTINGRESVSPLMTITDLYEDTAFLYNARYPLVKGYINSELVLVSLGIVAVALRRRWARYLVPVLIAFTVVPVILLWANYLPHGSLVLVELEVIALAAGISALAFFLGRKRPLLPYLITAGVTVTVILADILSGAALAKTSPFSYDVMTGARFYGIGNEFMGVLIGATIVLTGLVFDTIRIPKTTVKTLSMLLFVTVIYTIAAPNLGTNVGGMISAVAGLGVTTLVMQGIEIKKWTVAVVFLGIAVVLVGFVAYDLTRAAEAQSHIGRTVNLIRQNGLGEVGKIISRKWAMNWDLIRKTSWSWFYFICLAAILFMKRRLPAEHTRFAAKYPWFNRFIVGIVFGSLFALIFNDSGVVAAATMIIFAIAPYLTGLIHESRER